MLHIFHCKCCNLKQFALKFPKVFRSKIYSDAYEIIFKKTCKKCEQTNLHLEKLATQTFELRWKEISDLEEQQIIMEQELQRIEKNLSTKKEIFYSLWCPKTESNRQPTDYKSVALPIELFGQRQILTLF